MTLHLESDLFGVFEVVDHYCAAFLSSHGDCVAVSAERNRCQRLAYLDLFDLFALNNIVEENPRVKARTAE